MAGDSEDNGSDEDIFEALTDFPIGNALERGLGTIEEKFRELFS